MKLSNCSILRRIKECIIYEELSLLDIFFSLIDDEKSRNKEVMNLQSDLLNEIRVRNYYNAVKIIDDYLYKNYNSNEIIVDSIEFDLKGIYGITINILKGILNYNTNIEFYNTDNEKILIHYSFSNNFTITISKTLFNELKNKEQIYINVFLNKNTSYSELANFHISKFNENENGFYHYLNFLEYDKRMKGGMGYVDKTNYERDTFWAKTDGQLGDYDDFLDNGGNIDNI